MELKHFIECPRYGGRRPATACVHFDKYKRCRRHCSSLKQHLVQNPGFMQEVQDRTAPKEDGDGPARPDLFAAARHSGKCLPDPELACQFCEFVAKSGRGLKTHRTRSHQIGKRA